MTPDIRTRLSAIGWTAHTADHDQITITRARGFPHAGVAITMHATDIEEFIERHAGESGEGEV